MQSSLLIRGTVQACLFQANNAEFSLIGIQAVFPFLVFTESTVSIGNGHRVHCFNGKRFSHAFLDVTTPSLLFGWETV